MPTRKVVLGTGEIYHLLNRTVGNEVVFTSRNQLRRALELLNYYRFPQDIRYSRYRELSNEEKRKYSLRIKKTTNPLVEIYAFAFMPNHFHLLVKQKSDKGISKFMANSQNSFAKYFNLRNKRPGSLFQNMFKAVRVATDEQLVHVSRYIHLNPVSSFLIEIENLPQYPWTSFPFYVGKSSRGLIDIKLILGLFQSRKDYQRFVFDQKDYQRRLQEIKSHLIENHP